MSFLETIKAKIGEAAYSRIETVAETEVALAKQMPLVDEYSKKKFYNQRILLGELRAECELFEKTELRIFPTDLVNILSRCKLLFAAGTEEEYHQRGGGSTSIIQEPSVAVGWQEKEEGIDVLIDRHLSQLQAEIKQRTLLAHISGFTSAGKDANQQAFFQELFAKLGLPFESFLDDGHLIETHKQHEPGLRSYDQAGANEYFCAP